MDSQKSHNRRPISQLLNDSEYVNAPSEAADEKTGTMTRFEEREKFVENGRQELTECWQANRIVKKIYSQATLSMPSL